MDTATNVKITSYSNNISGFNSLVTCQSLDIRGGAAYSSVSGFNAVNKMGAVVIVDAYMSSLGTNFLVELDTLGGLTLIGNTYLNNIAAFDKNMHIQNLNVVGNANLANCSVLGLCKRAWASNNVTIGDNLACSTINVLRNSCFQFPDSDNDLVPNFADNCPINYNMDQIDINSNLIGDFCDPSSDADGDGLTNNSDNCDFVPNANQLDNNNNGIGDVCEVAEVCKVNRFISTKSEFNLFVNLCSHCSLSKASLTFDFSELINFNGFQFLKILDGNLTMKSNLYNGSKFFEGFKKLEKINGSLNLQTNFTTPLPQDSGFVNLKYIGQDLYINSGNYVNNLMFKNLDTVGYNLSLFNTCPSMNSIDHVGNDVLLYKDLRAIQNLSVIHGNLSLKEMSNFNAFNANQLTKVGGDLIINENPSLNVIDNFQGLDTIIGGLNITNNNLLSDISAFDHMVYLGGLSIKNNYFLKDCAVEAICNKIAIGSNVEIESNGISCMSPQKVQILCGPLSDSDNDGIFDALDNCPNISNPNQSDCNNNNIGDVCESFIDDDCDGVPNSADNCVTTYNPAQLDSNINQIGDACEPEKKVGVNTSNPKTGLHISNSTIYLDHPEKNIIFKASDGQCYMQYIKFEDNAPSVKLVLVPCPN